MRPVIAQSELPLMGLLEAPAPLLPHQLAAFGDDEEKAVKEAIRWAWINRRVRMEQSTASAHMGIPPSHLSNILNGKKHLPPHKINAYEWIVGNRAVSMTIERFRLRREEEQALVIARQIVGARRAMNA
jgi:hypothetical protein